MNPANLRRLYAEGLRQSAHLQVEGVVEAFAAVPRELFLGEGPWQIVQPLNPAALYRLTPDTALEHIYQDVVVAIDIARQLNNGQPSLHARLIEAAAPAPGESVLHIGCGTGYYTAILAETVGRSGRVVAYEVEADLATRANDLLRDWPQAHVEQGDSGNVKGAFDVIYVNAGATHARPEWIAALASGGRLILPLTAHLPDFGPLHGVGFVIRAECQVGRWPVRIVSQIAIFDCVGARDEAAEGQLRKLLRPEESPKIHWLQVDSHPPGGACLLHREGFCLQA